MCFVIKLPAKRLNMTAIFLFLIRFTQYVTGFANRSYIHAFNLASLMSHNFVCDYTITLKISLTFV